MFRSNNNATRGRFTSASAALSLVAVVLAVHGAGSTCSAFAPQRSYLYSPERRVGVDDTCFHGPLASTDKISPPTGSGICGTFSSLFGSAASGDEMSGVGSSVAQTFLAEQLASGRVLTTNEQRWWKRFGELEVYKQVHGDCNVPRVYRQNPQLGPWVNNQRLAYKQNKMSVERIDALESIGFEWSMHKDTSWWKRFGELEVYKQEQGDCNVPRGYKQNLQLGKWVTTQRSCYKQKKMSAERIEALERIGFEWVRPKGRQVDDLWWKRFGELEEYKREYGDCNVPRGYMLNPQLGRWVARQRVACKHNRMNAEQIEALESIGFEWLGRKRGQDDVLWRKRLGELEEYKQENGDCNVPVNYPANPHLAKWVMNQRAAYTRLTEDNPKRSRTISAERIEALNKIGFEWRLRDRPEWDSRHDELVAYKAKHGDTLVPMTAISDATSRYHGLALWVMVQRKQYRLRKERKHSFLSDDRFKKLNSIGFVWDAQEDTWDIRFDELQEFKANHGHTDVPKSWENKDFYNWVKTQRRFYNAFQEGKPAGITKERIKRLESIGFEWRSKNTYKWKIRFGELRDFYNKFGIGPIPRSTKTALHNWSSNQKKEYDKYINGEKTNMDEGRIKDLESIGFFDVYGK